MKSPFLYTPLGDYASPHRTIGSWTIVPLRAGARWAVSAYRHISHTSHGNHGVYQAGLADEAAAWEAGLRIMAQVDGAAGRNPRTAQ